MCEWLHKTHDPLFDLDVVPASHLPDGGRLGSEMSPSARDTRKILRLPVWLVLFDVRAFETSHRVLHAGCRHHLG